MKSDAAIVYLPTVPGPRRCLSVGIAALTLAAVGGVFWPRHFFAAYLATYLFLLGIALGSMVLWMIHQLTGGSWGLLIRRILEAAMRTLPLVALMFLPIVAGLRYLYPWAQPALVAASPQLQHQQFYLTPTWFCLRAVVYFVLWIGMAACFAAWSREQDETGRPRLAWKSLQLSAVGAVVYGVTLHFAAVDWGMSLEPVFHSTIWGPLIAAGQLLTSLAFALVVLARVIGRPPLSEIESPKVQGDLASLLFTFLILWAYMAWFQFMLVWIANLPVDVVWYLPRAGRPWLMVMVVIVVLHFVVPFFLLLVRRIKTNSRAVGAISGLILFMQLAFDYYLVIPEFPAGNLLGHMLDFLLPLGLGGTWLGHFLWQLQRYPLLARNDYNHAAALHLRELDAEESAHEETMIVG